MTGEGMFLLPPAPHLCQDCAAQHAPDQPHNAQAMFYQVKFQMEHGRAPTWADAYAHCAPGLQAAWRAALIERGVDVDAGQINPERRR